MHASCRPPRNAARVSQINLAEGAVKASLMRVLSERADDLEWLSQRKGRDDAASSAPIAHLPQHVGVSLVNRLEAAASAAAPFPRITYDAAVAALLSSGRQFSTPVRWEDGLATEHERFLAEEVMRGPVFVTDYPASLKPFYMRANDDGRTVAAFDLLVPGIGELIGGSAREERPLLLGARMAGKGLISPACAAAVAAAVSSGDPVIRGPPADTDAPNLDWYLDTRRFGGAPHAGFGLGFERLVMWATGTDNIRDVLPVPRTPGSCRL